MAEETLQNTQDLDAGVKISNPVLVTVGDMPDEKKVIIGLGNIKEYNGEKPTTKKCFYELSKINALLKTVDANKIPIVLSGQDKDGNPKYIKADFFVKKYVSAKGVGYLLDKLAIEVEPPKFDEKTKEIVSDGQTIYATKINGIYQFDNSEKNMQEINAFSDFVENGVKFTLSATKYETLENYPKLTDLLKKIENKSALIDLKFEKGKKVEINSITQIDKNGKSGATTSVKPKEYIEKANDICR